MTTPDFVLELREHIGHAPLWLTGVTAVVLRGDDVLLVRRTDTGEWSPVTGIIDPGEEPADAAVREVLEEADVVVKAVRLVWAHVLDPVTYPNGDEAQYLDLVFACSWLNGDPAPADGENSEAAWWPLSELPPMTDSFARRIRSAAESFGPALFSQRLPVDLPEPA